jgi:hypothetical protein
MRNTRFFQPGRPAKIVSAELRAGISLRRHERRRSAYSISTSTAMLRGPRWGGSAHDREGYTVSLAIAFERASLLNGPAGSVAGTIAYTHGIDLATCDGTMARYAHRTRHGEIEGCGIHLPDGAPDRLRDPATLAAEMDGKAFTAAGVARKDNPRLAQKVITALPAGLDAAERRRYVMDWIAERTPATAATAWAIHRPDAAGDARNHHAHLTISHHHVTAKGLGKTIRCDESRAAALAPDFGGKLALAWSRDWCAKNAPHIVILDHGVVPGIHMGKRGARVPCSRIRAENERRTAMSALADARYDLAEREAAERSLPPKVTIVVEAPTEAPPVAAEQPQATSRPAAEAAPADAPPATPAPLATPLEVVIPTTEHTDVQRRAIEACAAAAMIADETAEPTPSRKGQWEKVNDERAEARAGKGGQGPSSLPGAVGPPRVLAASGRVQSSLSESSSIAEVELAIVRTRKIIFDREDALAWLKVPTAADALSTLTTAEQLAVNHAKAARAAASWWSRHVGVAARTLRQARRGLAAAERRLTTTPETVDDELVRQQCDVDDRRQVLVQERDDAVAYLDDLEQLLVRIDPPSRSFTPRLFPKSAGDEQR